MAAFKSAYQYHYVPPATLVELSNHVWEVCKPVLGEGEVLAGVHVVQVVPLHILQQGWELKLRPRVNSMEAGAAPP